MLGRIDKNEGRIVGRHANALATAQSFQVEGVRAGHEDVDLHPGGQMNDVEGGAGRDGLVNRVATDVVLGRDRLNEKRDGEANRIGQGVRWHR